MYLSIFNYKHHGRKQNLSRGLNLFEEGKFLFFQLKIWSEDLSKGMTIKTFINYVHLNKVQMFIRQGRTQK